MADDKGTPNLDTENKEKESNAALEELKTSLDSISQKLEEYDTKFEELTDTVSTIPTSTEEDTSYVEKGWRPGDWNEVYSKVEAIADKKAEERLNSYEEERRAREEEKAAEDQAINQQFDTQLSQLEKDGRIPKIANEGNPNDEGKVARRELFQLGIEYESSNLVKMANLREKVRGKEPVGASAPVGSSARTTEAPKSVDYKEIHNKSMDQLVREEFPR